MGSVIGTILLKLALFLLPALEEWIRSQLKSPPPPEVPTELHNLVSQMLPPVSESEKVARELAANGPNISGTKS